MGRGKKHESRRMKGKEIRRRGGTKSVGKKEGKRIYTIKRRENK